MVFPDIPSYARQLVGKTKPQIALEAFVYSGCYIEENNFVNQLTFGARGQISYELDIVSINGDFGWRFFYFLGCRHCHCPVSSNQCTFSVH
jgi:hypothetical protein